MKWDWLTLTVFIIGSVLLFQIGCQEQALATEASEAELKASKEVTDKAKAETAAEPVAAGPRLMFESVTCDFGQVGPGTKNVGEFKFENAGDELLIIKKVTKSCGCTPFTLEKKEYEPGESGTLKVSYKASKRAGSSKKHLYVESNDKTKPKIALAVKATIVKKVEFEPKQLKLLLNKENAACPAITLTSVDGKPFSVKGLKATGRFRSTADAITAEYDSSRKATKVVIQPKVNMELVKKSHNGNVVISLTHPECGSVTIPFRVLPRFKIDPPSIVIHKVESGKPVTKEVWILNNYDEDFEVESVSSKEGTMKVLSQEKIDNRYKFELEITPPAAGAQKRLFSDVFFVDVKGGERLKINCRGFYLRQARKSATK
ncbi:MAG: DUF1573 domain-containing protein [Planctomycetota bacterium]|nr:MAG: DUF1573 domain-containing protein [Planctomycetota bacterium]